MIQGVVELDRVRRECRRLMTTRALAAAATSVVPIPGVDIAVDVGLLTSLLKQINERFGLSEAQVERMDPGAARKRCSSLPASAMASSAARCPGGSSRSF